MSADDKSSTLTGKRKRFSKNKKRNWKRTKINDVEEYLEDERLQIRTGGLAAEKKDDDLFVVETAVKEEKVALGESGGPLKRKLRERKPLKCEALLHPNPNIKPIFKKINVKKDRLDKKCWNVQEKVKWGIVSKKEIQSAKDGQQARLKSRKEKLARLNPTTYDLWEDTAPTGLLKDEHFAKVTRKKPVKVPTRFREKPSVLPAVEVPHPGSSYNPTYDDHQSLLQVAHNVELDKQRDEDRVRRALDEQFPTFDKAPTQESWLKEMSRGLGVQDETDDSSEEEEEGAEVGEDEEDGDDETVVATNPAIRRDNKKTEKQRKKDKAKKAQEKLKAKAKEIKLRKQEIFRLKAIKASLREQEQELAKKAAHKSQLKEVYESKPSRLGRYKYEAPDLEVKLSDELQGSLRQLKPEGNLLEDRLKSYQRRNIIEPRKIPKKGRGYKPKVFEKKGHKQITV